jgi:uncharacterized protein (DUF2249 family)
MNTNSPVETQVGPDGVLDVCALPCSIKHGLIIRTCLNLPVGGHFILLNGHHPQKLLNQLAAEWPEAFTWAELVNTPEECRVKITKLKLTIARREPLPPLVCSH